MTENHEFITPAKGQPDWHIPLNSNFSKLDTALEIRDVEANIDRYTPRQGTKLLAVDTGQIYLGDGTKWVRLSATGPSPSFDSVTSSRMNETVCVGSEAELQSALGSDDLIRLVGDVTASSELVGNYDGRDVVIDLNGKTVTRGDGVPEDLFTIDNPGGTVRIVNGRLDGNRRGQDFPNEKGYKELTIRHAERVYISRIAVVDNQGFSVNAVECDEVLVSDCTIDTRPDGIGRDGAGLDGVHVYDPVSVNVSNCSIRSGDDAIAITARKRRVNNVSIKGGTLSSPEHANGAKLHIYPTAGENVGFETVTIESTVHDVRGKGIIVVNDSSNGEGVTNGRIGGTVTNAGVNGVDLSVPFENVAIACAVRNVANHGINVMSGGRNLSINGVVQGADSYGIYLCDVESASIDAVVDGQGKMARGIRLEECTDVSISGTVRRTRDAPHANGIEGQACRDVVVSGVDVSQVATPVVSYDSSDHWTVVGNHGHSNASAQPSLSGTGNVVSSNNFR